MKRSSLYKPAPNDLASISFSSSLSNQLDLSSHTHHSTIQTNSCGNQLKLEQQQQQQKKNNNNSNNLQGGSDTLSHDTLSTVNSYSFNSKSSTHSSSSSSSSTYSAGSINHHHHPKAHLCLSMPLAKPTLSELKPQLSIESKIKAKSLIERRGSNNSLTLTLSTNKKKTQILNPSKEVEYLSIQTRLLAVNELIEVSKSTSNLYNEFYVRYTSAPNMRSRHQQLIQVSISIFFFSFYLLTILSRGYQAQALRTATKQLCQVSSVNYSVEF